MRTLTSAVRRLFGGTDEEPDYEYHLLQGEPERQRVETFDRPVSKEWVRYELDLRPGSYMLQAVDPETKGWGPKQWTLKVEEGERDEIREEIEELRADLARAVDGDDEDRPQFPTDRDELEGELLGVLAEQHGPDEALDRLERLEAAKSSGDGLASVIEDPTDTTEITGRVLLDAYERYGDDLGAILDNLDALTGAGQTRQQPDPAELQRQIDAQARALDIEGPTAGADGAAQPAATDGGEEQSPAKEIYEQAKEDGEIDEEADDEEGDDGD